MIIFIFTVFSLVLVSIKRYINILKTGFDHSTKHLEVNQKINTPLCVILSTLSLMFEKCGQTECFMYCLILNNY